MMESREQAVEINSQDARVNAKLDLFQERMMSMLTNALADFKSSFESESSPRAERDETFLTPGASAAKTRFDLDTQRYGSGQRRTRLDTDDDRRFTRELNRERDDVNLISNVTTYQQQPSFDNIFLKSADLHAFDKFAEQIRVYQKKYKIRLNAPALVSDKVTRLLVSFGKD